METRAVQSICTTLSLFGNTLSNKFYSLSLVAQSSSIHHAASNPPILGELCEKRLLKNKGNARLF
jgi:hypothetical protein